MATLWKQETKLHPAFDAINRCLNEDWFLLPFELRLQRAHAATLKAARILSAGEHEAIVRGLEEMARTCVGKACPESEAEDLHTWVEQTLKDRIGEPAAKIHTARSRNDQVATLLRMYVIESGGRLADELRELIARLCGKAGDWADLPMPLLTHTQFAAPGSAGFWALRYASSFARIRRHLLFCISMWRQQCPLGAGAVAGSSIPIDRGIQARELGFDGPSPNALEATSTRDDCLEWLAIAAQVGLHLQSFATDVILFSQTPLGWSDYPAEFATGSSMMPNKLNPDAMELLRGEACALAAAHGQLIMILKGLPSGYNRDLQCVKPVVRKAGETLSSLMTLTISFVERLGFNRAKLEAALDHGHLGATLRMEELVVGGKPLREAHHAVAAEVRAGGAGLESRPSDLERYKTLGSASPQETRRVADVLLASLDREGQV